MRSAVVQRGQAIALAGLTSRELQIARLAMSGLRNKSIAGELQLCEGTVKIHLHNIYRKLGIRSRMALVAGSHFFRG
jgi:two-component system nitrate/nitrite response regulator NarL